MRDEDLILLGVFSVVLTVWFIINALFCLTLMRCLQRISPRNRTMEPGLVWLNLVPCLGTIWTFITVTKLTESLRKEYRWRRWRTRQGFGGGVGTAHATLNLIGKIPLGCSFPFNIASLICLIVYWVQIAGFSARLKEPFVDPFDDGFDELDDDDYERRRLPRDEDDDYDERDRRDGRIRRDRRDDDRDGPDDRIRAGD